MWFWILVPDGDIMFEMCSWAVFLKRKGKKEGTKKKDWSLATHSKIGKSVPNLILKLWGEQNPVVFCVSTVVVMLPVALKLCKKTSDLFFEVPGVCVFCRT